MKRRVMGFGIKTRRLEGCDVAVTYKYDDNDRLTEEKSDSTNDADDRFTQYAYGTGTQQTNKSVYSGLTVNVENLLESTTYTYDSAGRLFIVRERGCRR